MSHLPHHGRTVWRQARLALEHRLREANERSSSVGPRPCNPAFHDGMAAATEWGMRLVGMHGRALRNARALQLPLVEFRFPRLPPAFDGYTILHLSDLHLGSVSGLEEILVATVAEIPADLVAITGDFLSRSVPDADAAHPILAPLCAALDAPDGVVAVLGNHDEAAVVDVLEGHGVRVLVNETMTLSRRGEHLHLVGTDDVHAFFTPAAPAALAACVDGFRIALVHTVDLADVAERHGYALYLSGHTHGGQVALPGGRPVFTMLDRHRHLARGAWRHGRLQGYTSAGTGTGEPPLRLNTRPEAALIRLSRG